jgi:hypothetical protein
MAIEVDGKKYRVVEDLGFSNRREQYAKVVMTPQGERIAVREAYRGAKWKFTQPLVLAGAGGSATGLGS